MKNRRTFVVLLPCLCLIGTIQPINGQWNFLDSEEDTTDDDDNNLWYIFISISCGIVVLFWCIAAGYFRRMYNLYPTMISNSRTSIAQQGSPVNGTYIGEYKEPKTGAIVQREVTLQFVGDAEHGWTIVPTTTTAATNTTTRATGFVFFGQPNEVNKNRCGVAVVLNVTTGYIDPSGMAWWMETSVDNQTQILSLGRYNLQNATFVGTWQQASSSSSRSNNTTNNSESSNTSNKHNVVEKTNNNKISIGLEQYYHRVKYIRFYHSNYRTQPTMMQQQQQQQQGDPTISYVVSEGNEYPNKVHTDYYGKNISTGTNSILTKNSSTIRNNCNENDCNDFDYVSVTAIACMEMEYSDKNDDAAVTKPTTNLPRVYELPNAPYNNSFTPGVTTMKPCPDADYIMIDDYESVSAFGNDEATLNSNYTIPVEQQKHSTTTTTPTSRTSKSYFGW